jgi:hypothetical protein
LDEEKAKNSVSLSENELMALLQLIFALGIQYKQVSPHTLESYTKKLSKKFSYKKGVQLVYFLLIIMTLEPNKLYKPNELNKMTSKYIRNFVPDLLHNFGMITDDQFYSIKIGDSNLILPRELTELLQIMTDDLNLLEKVEGIEYIKEKHDIHPGRKKINEIKTYEGYPSRYKLSNVYIIIKNLFNKPEFLLLFRNFINENESIKNYLIFTHNTLCFFTSKFFNVKIKLEDKERIKNELFRKGKAKLVEEDIIQKTSVLLFLSEEEIKNLSIDVIDSILSSNDYTYILFLIALFYLITLIK